MTSKGQCTIPKEVREELGLESGTKLYFVKTAHGYMLRAAKNSILALAGTVSYDGPPLSISDMDDAIALAVTE